MARPDRTEPIRLLVVDDEPDVQTLFELRFRRELREGRIHMQFASSAELALARVAEDPTIEVVVTDLNMPGMNGLELLGHLEALGLHLKTIVLTAYGDMRNIRTAMMQGAFDFQMKPLDLDDLRTTIEKACTIVRQLRAGERARAQVGALEQRNRYLKDVFGKYVNDEVVDRLLASPDGPVLEGERRTLTVLMADIRGFTRLTEELPPEDVVTVLNAYLTVATDQILSRGGTINEILGDGLLVFFGAPLDDDRAPEHAVAAAVGLQLAMAELNQRLRLDGLPELAVGIAIHTGQAVVGTVGSERRLKYTAVGPSLNLVGRIESQARGGQILVSDATYRLVEDLVSVAGRFEIRLKGVREPLVVHALRGIRGDHDLHLPQATHVIHGAPVARPLTLARVVRDRIGEPVQGWLLAAGPDAARLRTSTVLAPLDEAVVWLAGAELFGTVSECTMTDEGQCELTLVYTSGSADARRRVAEALAS